MCFSFSHSVFKRLLLQTHEKKGLFGKGLNISEQDLRTGKMKEYADGNFKSDENGRKFP